MELRTRNEASAPVSSEDVERVLILGDLAKLTPDQRVIYYRNLCDSVGLNPLTQPFQYLTLSGKLVLYARKDCTEQLRKIHGVSLRITSREVMDDVYVVTAEAADKIGRVDSATGAVPIGNLRGEAKANAFMKAETKAKRRVTLSICGLGMLDESEIDSIPGAQPFTGAAPTPPIKDGEQVSEGDVVDEPGTFERIDPATKAALILSMEGSGLDVGVILSAYRIKTLDDLPADKAQECANRIAKFAETRRRAKEVVA